MPKQQRIKPSPNSLDLRPVGSVRTRPAGATIRSWPSIPWKWVIIAIAVLAVVASLTVGFFAWKNHKKTAETGEAVLATVKAKISRHYLLPTDETPALATVTDTSKLKTPFFKNTKAGDRILIYQTNHVAIVYRPSIDRIVSVGPVSIDTPQGAAPVGQ